MKARIRDRRASEQADQASDEFNPYFVWRFRGSLGFRKSVAAAGTVAAPLLVGISLALLILVLPSFSEETQVALVDGNASVVAHHESISAAPGWAALFFAVAALLLIACLQATLTSMYHDTTPSQLREWYPEYFRGPTEYADDPPDVDLTEWNEGSAPAVWANNEWIGGFPRRLLHEELENANRWARGARHLYHAGLMALLVGLAVLTLPPSGGASAERVGLCAIAWLGVTCEVIWIASTYRTPKT